MAGSESLDHQMEQSETVSLASFRGITHIRVQETFISKSGSLVEFFYEKKTAQISLVSVHLCQDDYVVYR
jgi:hypothetical protein